MKETDPAVAKLERIQQLWIELERETPDGPQYKALVEQIRVLAAEYLALVNAPQKPDRSR
ncbi:MAG: hypothetical protein WA871_02670 [Candidatus Acidiferrales bacterium]